MNHKCTGIDQGNSGFSRILNNIQACDQNVGDGVEAMDNKMLIFIDDDKFFKTDHENGPKSTEYENDGVIKQLKDSDDIKSTDYGIGGMFERHINVVKPSEDAVDTKSMDHGISDIKIKQKDRLSKARIYSLIDEVRSALVERIGENLLLETCRYLRKRKLALLDDKVFDSMTLIFGEKMVDYLPEICKLLLLEKTI